MEPLLCFSSPSSCPSLLLTIFQVWFQNRRAKFRRNERAMLANKNASLLKSYSGDVTAVEQPTYLVLLQDPLIISPGGRPLRTGEWLAHSPLLHLHTFLSGWSHSKLLVQLADISYWVNLFRDIQLADIPRFSQEITSCPRSRVWGRRERGRPTAVSSWTQELLQRFQRWGRI